MPILHFLIAYDRLAERISFERQFTDADEAAKAYASLEREFRGQDHVEIVLIGSDSYETVKRTHSNYFPDGTGVPFRELVS